MGEIASTADNSQRFKFISADHVLWVEESIEIFAQLVTIPREFIIPGDTQVGAMLDVARTVVRRAERRVAELSSRGDIQNPDLLSFMNRLSSLLFLIELYENQFAGKTIPTLAKKDHEK